MFDFPASPSEGQVFQPSGGPLYKFSNGTWTVPSTQTSPTIVSDTPPPGPKSGQIWYESDTGNSYIYYDDGNSQQWVQFNSGTGIQGPISVDAPADGKYYARANSNWVASPAQETPGVFKIASGVTASALATVDFAIPSGYQGFDLWFSNAALSAYAGLGLRYSWDGGATFPQAANQYYYIQDNMTTTAAGGFTGAGGTNTAHFIHQAAQASGGAKVNGRVWWNMADAAEVQQTFSEAGGYDLPGLIYRRYRTWSQAGAPAGPPNFGRFFLTTGTLAAGMRWQLNGVK